MLQYGLGGACTRAGARRTEEDESHGAGGSHRALWESRAAGALGMGNAAASQAYRDRGPGYVCTHSPRMSAAKFPARVIASSRAAGLYIPQRRPREEAVQWRGPRATAQPQIGPSSFLPSSPSSCASFRPSYRCLDGARRRAARELLRDHASLVLLNTLPGSALTSRLPRRLIDAE